MTFVLILLTYVAMFAVVCLVMFWVIRAAILSALAADRHRSSQARADARPTYGAGGSHWLDGDGR